MSLVVRLCVFCILATRNVCGECEKEWLFFLNDKLFVVFLEHDVWLMKTWTWFSCDEYEYVSVVQKKCIVSARKRWKMNEIELLTVVLKEIYSIWSVLTNSGDLLVLEGLMRRAGILEYTWPHHLCSTIPIRDPARGCRCQGSTSQTVV